ncbi:hypothetical protein PSZ46_23450, partial [Shigella flexneri]|nr:hypothetical protein [Shigella flexneri]
SQKKMIRQRISPLLLRPGQLQRLQLACPQQQGRYPLTYHLFLGVIARE